MSTLFETAPDDPLGLASAWLEEARAKTGRANPGAMALATADEHGRPAVRMVLLKALSAQGFGVFHTHYESRKGRELASNGRAAGVLYWEELGRQLRIEGPVVRSPEKESDDYFRTRAPASQLNAWASAQSRPLENPDSLLRRVEACRRELGAGSREDPHAPGGVPRPPFWGGFRLWIDALELWVEGKHRFHERIRYERALRARDAASFEADAWSRQRLQP